MAKGTVQTNFYNVIPLVLFFSKSRITNCKYVHIAHQHPATGYVYSLHITPFIVIGITHFVNLFKRNKIKK